MQKTTATIRQKNEDLRCNGKIKSKKNITNFILKKEDQFSNIIWTKFHLTNKKEKKIRIKCE